VSDLSNRMDKLDDHIESCHTRARDLLGASDAQVAEGLELHRDLLVCDSFGFLPTVLSPAGVAEINRASEEHWDASEVQQLRLDVNTTSTVYDEDALAMYEHIFEVAGVNATFTNAGCGPNINYTLRCVARFQHICDGLRDRWTKAIHAEQAREAFAENKRAMFFSANNPPSDAGFRDGYEQLYWLGAFHRFGFRMMHLTYNRRNWVGDGCMEEANGGLSDFGYTVVERMNQLGIIIDTPHTGTQTTLDAARVSKAPIAASHTVCRALHDHPRGKYDEELRAIADTGGFVGITCIPYFLAEHGTIVELLDHIDHAVKVMGIDHVGIGTDIGFSAPPPDEPEMLPLPRGRGHWWSFWPEGTSSADPEVRAENSTGSLSWICWPYFTIGLMMRGYSEEEIAKIVGGNILRTCADVEAAATHGPS